jgi:hypothetical protein
MEIGVDGGWMVDGWWKGGRLVSSYFSGGFDLVLSTIRL